MTDLIRLPSFAELENEVEGLRGNRPLKVGWAVNKVLNEAWEAEKGQPDAPSQRAVYTFVLDQLAEHFSKTSHWDKPAVARDRLVDYSRVTRFFTPERYRKLKGKPKLGQLRACLVESTYWMEYPEDEIMARVAWCEQNGWPATAKIAEHFASSVCDDELSIDDEKWLPFDHARKVAYDKAVAYLDATASAPMGDFVIINRRMEAQKLISLFVIPAVYEVAKWD